MDDISRKVVRRVLGSGPSYSQWLKDRDYKLSRDEAVNHKHFVTHLVELQKAVEVFARQWGGSVGGPGDKFTVDESERIADFRRLLVSVAVPISRIEVVEDKPLKFF